MKIALLSGKGGTGKTFLSVNLAAAAGACTYIDCDVEEPNGHLFLRPQEEGCKEVAVMLPTFDADLCDGCRSCVDFCRFNALVYIRTVPTVFPTICHSCGGCVIACPTGAVGETTRPIGQVRFGQSGEVKVVTGILKEGEVTGVPLIEEALALGLEAGGWAFIDCPPGSGCAVLESVSQADYCVLVAEPTAFGLHNFAMVLDLVQLLDKPCGVVINKEEGRYPQLEDYCRTRGVDILSRIPNRESFALAGARGEIAVRQDQEAARLFSSLLDLIQSKAEAALAQAAGKEGRSA